MICEMIVLLRDSDHGDTTKNRKAGDVVIIKTEAQIAKKYEELFQKGMITQELIDTYTDIITKVDKLTLGDLQKARLRWPWGKEERKLYLTTQMDLSAEEIDLLSRPSGNIISNGDGFEFVQTAFRAKTLNIDTVTALLDKESLLDKEVDYQPLIDQITSKSHIVDRDPSITRSK